MGIPISKGFVSDLIESRWDRVDVLEQAWHQRVELKQQKTGSARDRGTIYRWLKIGLPNKRDEIFGFSAALGIDPLVILDIENPAFQKLLKLEWVFFLSNMSSRGRMSAIWPLIRPSAHWPSLAISHDYYSRAWTTVEFSHAAETLCNVYASIRLHLPPDDDPKTSHRIYYFAYRRKGARDGLWRPYGIVRKRGFETICMGHNGDVMELPDGRPKTVRTDENGSVGVETFFGPGPADFRIACIDPFTADLVVPSQGGDCLRFRA